VVVVVVVAVVVVDAVVVLVIVEQEVITVVVGLNCINHYVCEPVDIRGSVGNVLDIQIVSVIENSRVELRWTNKTTLDLLVTPLMMATRVA
jgi:hypothetical protein